jgi:hypothetical protein
MELLAVTSQLQIVNGQVSRSPDIPGLLAQSAPSKSGRGRGHDFLFAHLTLSGSYEETATLYEDLLDNISIIYYESSGSVTAALRKAIIETNRLLLAHNLNSATTLREGAVTCVVFKGDEIFFAQVGEAFALIGRNIGIERLPTAESRKSTPLGRTAGIDIHYYHNWLQAGDMMLLADPRLSHASTSTFEPVLINSNVETGLGMVTDIVGEDSARLILAQFTDEAPGYLPDAALPPARATSRQHLPPPTQQPIRENESHQINEVDEVNESVPSVANVDVEVVETTARRATAKAALGLSQTTAWMADLLEKVRPSTEGSDDSHSWALPAFLAIAIPIIVGVVVVGVYLQRGRAVQFGEMKSDISNALLTARDAPSEAESEVLYKNVLGMINEAELLRPNDGDIASYRSEALLGLDGLVGVSRLNGKLFHVFSSDSMLSAVAMSETVDEGIYVLDSVNNQVFRLQLTEDFDNGEEMDPELVIFEAQVLGSHIVGAVTDIMWRPSGNQVTRDGLAMLDSRGALISHFPNFSDTRAVPLGLASDWVQPIKLTTFNERIYILDPGAQVIWRYFAEGEGFTTSEDQRYIEFVEDADIGNVVDLAIYSEDGSVLLLYNDGRLRRYVNGRFLWSESNLPTSGLESPLISPTAIKIVGRGLNSSIFVLDPGSDRIVQFSLGGTYLAQYKASDEAGSEVFAEADDFVVLENPLRIIVTAGNHLYIATLP